MKLLSLDISTNTGYAVYEDGKLIDSGTLWPERSLEEFKKDPYPFDYLKFCAYVANNILKKFESVRPDVVVIEETTASQNNLSQKKLEYIHCLFLSTLTLTPVRYSVVAYIRDGVWKRITGALQNDEERRWNAKVSRLKKKAGKGKRVKIDGEYAYPYDDKDYYIRAANEQFPGKNLKKKDENEAAAILLGLAFLKNAPVCDGTTYGGLLPKESPSTQGPEEI
jgi:hypothetical protein